MNHFFEKTICVGCLGVNCTVLADTEKERLYIIDPGDDAENIANAAEPFRKYSDKKILLTHAHIDHITGVKKTAELLEITKIFLHPGDSALYNNPENSLLPYFPAVTGLPAASWPPEDDNMICLHCPGHSPGGMTYYFPELQKAFTGDTIFRESIGRTDLPGGDYAALIQTIRDVIFTLPDEVILIPGHGGRTMVSYEKKNNPFFR